MSLHRLSANQVSYVFSEEIEPVVTVDSGTALIVEARDAYDWQFDESMDIDRYLRERGHRASNPVTGPIAVRDAQPGDGLAVTIQDIRLHSRGYVAAAPGSGVLKDIPLVPRVYPFDVREDGLWFDGLIRLPLRPMLGVIGVAPRGAAVPCLQLGYHGGNMDFNDITRGTTVHFPVLVPGGRVSLGDAHASMGSCEPYSGVNTSADVQIFVEREPGAGWQRPWFETDREVMTIGVEAKLEDAIHQASLDMSRVLQARLGVTHTESVVLIGAAADVRLGQAANFGVNVSAYVAFPKSALR